MVSSFFWIPGEETKKEEGRWKLTSERIYWDQASVLRQVGLLEQMDLPISGKEPWFLVRDVN